MLHQAAYWDLANVVGSLLGWIYPTAYMLAYKLNETGYDIFRDPLVVSHICVVFQVTSWTYLFAAMSKDQRGFAASVLLRTMGIGSISLILVDHGLKDPRIRYDIRGISYWLYHY